MGFSTATIIQAFFLTLALSIDAMVSGFAYGTRQIKIPAGSTITITMICGLMLAAAMLSGNYLNQFISEKVAAIICFTILLILGIIKLFDSFFKTVINKNNGIKKRINFSLFNIRFILNIYANPEHADTDYSHVLSPLEAVSLALALSLDGLAVGFGAGLKGMNIFLITLLSLITNAAAILIGCQIGRTLAKKIHCNLSWIGGLLLIILAFMKL